MDTLLQTLALIGIGLVLGLEHALETDHVVAVTTLTSQTTSVRRAALLAAVWGIGHTVTLFVVSLVVLVLKVTIPDNLASFFEFCVGVLLIALGANVVRTVLAGTLHSHTHAHDGVVHSHVHSHTHAPDHHHHNRRSFFVGIVHGLAGSAALVLLVLSSVQSLAFGLLFIVCFGVGSVVGMVLITILISMPVQWSRHSERLNRAVQLLAGSAGVAAGLVITVKIAFPGFSTGT